MKGFLFLPLLLLVACDSGEAQRNATIEGRARSTDAIAATSERQAAAREQLEASLGESSASGDKEILFGDLHAHTTWSFDGFMFSLPLLGGEGAHPPNDACDFARHCAQVDFFALTDHAESLLPELWQASKESVRECNARAGDPEDPDMVAFMGFEWSQAGSTPEDHWGHRCVVFPETDDASLPVRPIASADTRQNMLGLHKIVGGAKWLQPWTLGRHDAFLDFIDRNQAIETCADGVDPQDLPSDCREVAATPGELNRKLDRAGIEAMTIPHGTTWGVYTPATTTIDKHLSAENYDPERMRLIEVMSGHGNSEEYRSYASKIVAADGSASCAEPTENFLPCCWQAGEIMRSRCGDLPGEECERRVSEARRLASEAWVNPSRVFPDAAAEEWLDCDQCRDCFRPSFSHRPKESVQYAMALSRSDEDSEAPVRFRYGFVASSDGHTGRPGHGYKQLDPPMMSDTRAEPSFPYASMISVVAGGSMEDPQTPLSVRGGRVGLSGNDLRVASFLYPGGLAAVHSTSRARGAIWDAMQRREVYGTSGPRILLWFDLLNGADGRQPMGSEVAMADAPHFEVRAVGSFEPKPGCPEDSASALSAERLDYLCHGECYHPSDRRRIITSVEVIRIRPTAPGEDPGAGIEDPWRRFECAPDPAGCTLRFDDPEYAEYPTDTVYYVRALEEPSQGLNGQPLETKFDHDGNAIQVSPCTPARVVSGGCPAPVQERAWSSPIFVDAPESPDEALVARNAAN
jgi:hypothetical protein